MLTCLPSAPAIRRLNRRQRKKLRVGEFQEHVFDVRMQFHQPLVDAALDVFLDGFIAFAEARRLVVGGLGGALPLSETEAVVSTAGRGSPSESDRHAVLDWLRQRPEVAGAEAGDFIDGWYCRDSAS